MIPPFETTFAVPLTCESCIQDVSTSLNKIAGINKVNGDLQQQIVSVLGTAAPSAIVEAIQSTGRDAILRGSGTADSAAVCILETHSESVMDKVRGLVRIVQVAPSMTIFDISTRGLSPGTYNASIREAGDIMEGAESVGGMWGAQAAKREGSPVKGMLGAVEVSKSGIGSVFVDKPIQVWEMIGRAIVVSRQQEGKFSKQDPDTLVGVIARSAGVWDNDKTVCSCSGKTVWEERKEQLDRGML
ncbi:Cu,Zn superoxide dismutase-like protein [Aulographum hederae CBS 113979]|uniref:Superoxide dismutase 1 copper chaperone n=1 Tax=Aulographum hederae CBS 113979 TaxID=1176131 RepID=A0A6G1GRS7_9PEZI|nr:Cu,Zn superoxide dismutase-like protein [Aulographum hederae CBS 113979]